MTDKDFLIRYEELLDKGYCNCNEMNCIDNNTPRKILNIAKTLQEENQQLKKDYQVLRTTNISLNDLVNSCQQKIREQNQALLDIKEYIKENNLWSSKETENGYSYMKNECRELLDIINKALGGDSNE